MKKIAIIIISLIGLLGVAYAQLLGLSPSGPAVGGGTSGQIINNAFGVSNAVDPGNYYITGTGNPCVSTADCYHTNGIYDFAPVDLLNSDCGTAGSTIAAAKGRYAWVFGPNHTPGLNDWSDGSNLFIGYSDDPAILPLTVVVAIREGNVVALTPGATFTGVASGSTTMTVSGCNANDCGSNGIVSTASRISGTGVVGTPTIASQGTGIGGNGTYTLSSSQTFSTTITSQQVNIGYTWAGKLVCNPDDMTNPFYIYAQVDGSGIQLETGLIKSPDLVSFTTYGAAIRVPTFATTAQAGSAIRTGTNAWKAVAPAFNWPQNSLFGWGIYTSIDGQFFSFGGLIDFCVPASINHALNCPLNSTYVTDLAVLPLSGLVVGAQTFIPGRTDTLQDGSGNRTGPQYVSRIPVDSNFNTLGSPAIVNIGPSYSGVGAQCGLGNGPPANFTGPQYLMNVTGYVESGVALYFAEHGFFPDKVAGTNPCGLGWANGGGLWQEFLDVNYEVFNTTPAANASPFGVKASCASGTATISWYNILGGTVTVYRSATKPAASNGTLRGTFTTGSMTLVGTTAGASLTDTPGSTAQFWYVAVHGTGGQAISTYCSSGNARVNAHINRVALDGGTVGNIDQTWLASVDNFLNVNPLYSHLLFATDASFGTKGSLGKVYDYGTTRIPRGGDFTLCTNSATTCGTAASTTYSATGFNSTAPAWVNGNRSAYGYYGGGRVNNLRRMTRITVCAVVEDASGSDYYVLGLGEFAPPGLALGKVSGVASFMLGDNSITKTATAPLGTTAGSGNGHIICGTFDGTTLKAWGDGTMCTLGTTCQTGLAANNDLSLNTTLKGQVSGNQLVFLESGALNTKYIPGSFPYVFDDSNAPQHVAAIYVFDDDISGMTCTTPISSNCMAAFESIYKTRGGL